MRWVVMVGLLGMVGCATEARETKAQVVDEIYASVAMNLREREQCRALTKPVEDNPLVDATSMREFADRYKRDLVECVASVRQIDADKREADRQAEITRREEREKEAQRKSQEEYAKQQEAAQAARNEARAAEWEANQKARRDMILASETQCRAGQRVGCLSLANLYNDERTGCYAAAAYWYNQACKRGDRASCPATMHKKLQKEMQRIRKSMMNDEQPEGYEQTATDRPSRRYMLAPNAPEIQEAIRPYYYLDAALQNKDAWTPTCDVEPEPNTTYSGRYLINTQDAIKRATETKPVQGGMTVVH